MTILQLDKVTGGYNRSMPVIRNLSFTVGQGEMVGIIGLNGAGKSTTIKHIIGLLEPTEGNIRIQGQTREQAGDAYRSAFAYVPESPLLYEELTVREHLRFAAMAYGLEEEVYDTRLKPIAETFQMMPHLDRLPALLSKGMRQKVMVMICFLVQPDLYVIDEPFLGLDPLGMRALLELMVQKKEEGAGILISSHILSTIEKYCDRFVLLHQGGIRAYGDLESLRELADLPDGSLDDVFYRLIQGM
jgi:ABC-2 type transport system ATP-binding protein